MSATAARDGRSGRAGIAEIAARVGSLTIAPEAVVAAGGCTVGRLAKTHEIWSTRRAFSALDCHPPAIGRASEGRVGAIRIGIGGWTYEPWRGLFFPEGLRHADELAYAAERLTSIEINGTFYRTQTPKTFRTWHDGTPASFVFAVKAHRAAAQRTEPADAAPAIARFLASGLTELGDKLGPIIWQLPAGRRFDADRFARFLDLLPPAIDGVPVRHVVEAVHDSFGTAPCTALLQERGVARAIVEKAGVVLDETVTAQHVYLRLEASVDEEPLGYPPAALDAWASRLTALAVPERRSVFAYVISGAKHRNPAAAMALLERIG